MGAAHPGFMRSQFCLTCFCADARMGCFFFKTPISISELITDVFLSASNQVHALINYLI